MDSNDFMKAASRTFNPSQPAHLRCNNAILGLAGELGEIADTIKKHVHHGHELDKVHLIKECGDVEWYIAQMCDVFGWDMPDYNDEWDMPMDEPHITVLLYIGRIGAMAEAMYWNDCIPKRALHEELTEWQDTLDVVHAFICNLTSTVGSSIQEVWQVNIDKLQKRYPNGFNSADSINRSE